MTPTCSPSYDNKIFKKFSARTLESKMENKLSLQKEIGFIAEKKIPLICIPGGMTDELGGNLFLAALPGILSLNSQIVVRGVGSPMFGHLFTKLENEHRHRVKILKDDDAMQRKMYAAADMSLFFAPDHQEVANCLCYGAVPISVKQHPLEDYNPVQESGNAFIADLENTWGWYAALVRAIETFKLPYDWRTIQRHAMETAH